MTAEREITWFIEQFGARIEAELEDTPFSLPMFAGIAYQETGYLWSRIRSKTEGEEAFLDACVGDIIGEPSRKAFPTNSAALKRETGGSDMYAIARAALQVLGDVAPEYARYVRYEERFCRGYGLFQYDLQFFKVDPDYFLTRGWSRFEGTFGKALSVITEKANRLGLYLDRKLSVDEATKVAIAYNRGSYNPALGLRQGHENSAGEFYGELVNRYIKMALRLAAAQTPASPALNPGPEGSLGAYMVNARSGLVLRAAPSIDSTRLTAIAEGKIVSVLSFSGSDHDWALVDLEGDGLADGFMSSAFLVKAA